MDDPILGKCLWYYSDELLAELLAMVLKKVSLLQEDERVVMMLQGVRLNLYIPVAMAQARMK